MLRLTLLLRVKLFVELQVVLLINYALVESLDELGDRSVVLRPFSVVCDHQGGLLLEPSVARESFDLSLKYLRALPPTDVDLKDVRLGGRS